MERHFEDPTGRVVGKRPNKRLLQEVGWLGVMGELKRERKRFREVVEEEERRGWEGGDGKGGGGGMRGRRGGGGGGEKGGEKCCWYCCEMFC